MNKKNIEITAQEIAYIEFLLELDIKEQDIVLKKNYSSFVKIAANRRKKNSSDLLKKLKHVNYIEVKGE